MERRDLPPSLKNHVFEAIQTHGMDATEFKWEGVMGPWTMNYLVSRIDHPRTGFFFLFDVGTDNEYRPQAWPAAVTSGPISESSLKSVITKWAQAIAPEIAAPDLWKLAQDQNKIGTDPAQANAPFTPAEQKQVEAGLFQLEEFVYQSEPDLGDHQRAAVKARFAYIKNSVARLGRVDWTSLMIGQMFSMVAEKIISVQTFTAAYNVAANLLAKFVAAGAAVATRIIGT